jgi:transposase-like protein
MATPRSIRDPIFLVLLQPTDEDKLPAMATPRSTRDPLFLGRWFQDEVIIIAVRWYLAYPLSYRQVCEILRDRGVSVAPSTVMRWVVRYAPDFEKRWRKFEKPVELSWRVDETYIKVASIYIGL